MTIGGLELDICASCGSTWFDRTELEAARDAADALMGAEFRAVMRALSPASDATDFRTYVGCPVCDVPLVRRAHPHVGGVVAHACPEHGAWVERRHLLRLLQEIELHGAAELSKRRVHEAAARDRRQDDEYRDYLDRLRRWTPPATHQDLWFWF